jgi:hypothetical protein
VKDEHAGLTKLDEDWMKSESGKERWRVFIERYVHRCSLVPLARSLTSVRRSYKNKKEIKDYNFGSLIRTDARQEYGETNTIFGACFPAEPLRVLTK